MFEKHLNVKERKKEKKIYAAGEIKIFPGRIEILIFL
jgi:hypothetical protein